MISEYRSRQRLTGAPRVLSGKTRREARARLSPHFRFDGLSRIRGVLVCVYIATGPKAVKTPIEDDIHNCVRGGGAPDCRSAIGGGAGGISTNHIVSMISTVRRPGNRKCISLLVFAALVGLVRPTQAQDSSVPGAAVEEIQSATAPSSGEQDKIDKRAFGVLPNYRTADGTQPFRPITASRKMYIAAKDSFDWPVFPAAAAFAALHQIQNQNPRFGQGMAGYSKRLVTAYLDQMAGNMMAEGIMPSLFRQDPRYFRRSSGSVGSRAWYAVTRIFVCRNDSGRNVFNFSEVLGNSVAAAMGNVYYSDARKLNDNLGRLAISLATDAGSQVAKEFWPDIKRKLMRKKAGG